MIAVSLGILILLVVLVGGTSFPLTEGAELEFNPDFKMAPYMDLETGLYGYIDIEGQVVIEPRYHYAEAFSEGIAVVAESGSKGTFYGYINKKGDTVISLSYQYARGFHEGLAIVSQNGDLFVINKSGDISHKIPDNMISGDYSYGMSPVYSSFDSDQSDVSNSGYIDRKGNIVLEIEMVEGYPFSEDLAQIQVFVNEEDVKWGYINQEGTMVIDPIYENSEAFTEGMAAVAIRDSEGNKKWGYINQSGEFVIEPIFDSAFAFSENLAVVYVDDKGYGYIDRNGQFVIGPAFKMATSYSNGYASVRTDATKFKCIDKTGVARFTADNKLIFEFR